MKLENTKAQMRKGVLEYCILAIISRGEVYTSDILDTLKEAKLVVVEGTIYPILTRLKNAGMLTYEWKESTGGPPRKYFQLTPAGEDFSSELAETWDELTHAVNVTTRGSNIKKSNQS